MPGACPCLQKKYEQHEPVVFEIRLTALHRTGGARLCFRVVGFHIVGFSDFRDIVDVTRTTLREGASGNGESSQGGGDEDGELGEHHFELRLLALS